MRALEADRHLDMVTTQAVRDAGTPVIAQGPEDTYRVQGADPLPRSQASRLLVQEWRLTPVEAAAALDQACY
jgi:hypothetical protein